MKLYEISAEYCASVEMLEEHLASGQIDEQMYLDTLDSLDGEFAEKGLNIGKLIKTWEAEEKAIKDVVDTRTAMRKTINTRIDRLKSYLVREMVRTGLTPKDAEMALSLRTSEAVVVDDESALPVDYWVETTSRTPDKTLIKKAIKDGHTVPGARIDKRQNLQIK